MRKYSKVLKRILYFLQILGASLLMVVHVNAYGGGGFGGSSGGGYGGGTYGGMGQMVI